MTLTLIKHFYEIGVFDLKKMKALVYHKVITKDDYFEITRKHYLDEEVL